MISERIIESRKKNGWSQEELAERMNVSRQAVSKWESGQSTPDIEKIIIMSELFGVTTDYLLKEEISYEKSEMITANSTKRVSVDTAREYIAWRRIASVRIAIATFLCMLSVIPLVILGGVSEYPQFGISENFAGAVGIITLIVTVSIAVAVFVWCGLKNSTYEFLDGKEHFEIERGVEGLVREVQSAYRSTYIKYNITGTCLCVLSPVSLICGAFTENELLLVFALALTILIAGVGVIFFIISGVRWASMQKLVKEGEYAPKEKRKTSIRETVGFIYWLTVLAIFLSFVFFGSGRYDYKFLGLIWPIAGILFAILMVVLNLFIDKDK